MIAGSRMADAARGHRQSTRFVIVTRNNQHFVPIGVSVLSPDEAGGFHAVWVTGNWRIIFRFVDGDAYDLDHLDYT